MSDIPCLTIKDKINSHLFFDEIEVPTLIVEGKTDVRIYGKFLTASELDWSEIDLVIGTSKNEILKCYSNGLPFRYLALIDSDFDYYNQTQISDERILYTHFYNMENYLTTYMVLYETFKDFETLGTKHKFEDVYNNAIESIKPFILLSYAKNKNKWTFKLEDFSIYNWKYDKQNKLFYEELEEYALKELTKSGDIIEKIDWAALEVELNEDLKKFEIDHFLNGKHKLDAVFEHMKIAFPEQIRKRHLDMFITDLCKNFRSSLYVMELIRSIDERLTSIFKIPNVNDVGVVRLNP